MKVDKHEDTRRFLIEWVTDFPVKSCKVIIAKGNTEVGLHRHEKKDELFYLLQGECEYKVGNKVGMMNSGTTLFIPRKTYHSFKLSDKSILLGAATEPFDPNDEIQ